MIPRRSSFRPRSRAPLAVLMLNVAMAVALNACSSEAAGPAAPPPPEVGVARVLDREVAQWDGFTGRVAAVDAVELRPRVSGYIERIAYREGDEVARGQLLFVIDQRPYRAALARAEAELDRARSEAQLARSQGARAQVLIDAKAISREEFDARRAASAQGSAAVRAAEAAVAVARLDLQYTEVRSPIAGRAGRAMVTVGNLAQADASVLTSVVSLDPMYVYFDADEQAYLRHAAQARAGGRAAMRNPVRVGLADETGYPHAGTVDFVDNQVDPATGTVRARAVVPNPDRALTPGLFARVQLQGAAASRALLVDGKAVMTDQDRKYVYVLGPGNTAQRRDVTVGRDLDGLRVIASGLTAKDTVIVSGTQKVFFPGMPVAPKTVPMTPPSPAKASPPAGGAVAAR